MYLKSNSDVFEIRSLMLMYSSLLITLFYFHLNSDNFRRAKKPYNHITPFDILNGTSHLPVERI